MSSQNSLVNRNLKVAHVNVRSLQPHLEALSDAVMVHEIDIVGVTETWLTRNTEDRQLLLNDFTLLREDYRGRGSGVGMYIRKSLKFIRLQTASPIEHLIIKVTINSKNYIIGVIYRNHDINYNTFISELENIMSQCLIKHEYVILLGDFNINILNLSDLMTRTYLASVNELGFTQLITEPTRIKSLLDHILVSDIAFVLQSGVESCEISDHDLIYVTINSKKPKNTPQFL